MNIEEKTENEDFESKMKGKSIDDTIEYSIEQAKIATGKENPTIGDIIRNNWAMLNSGRY